MPRQSIKARSAYREPDELYRARVMRFVSATLGPSGFYEVDNNDTLELLSTFAGVSWFTVNWNLAGLRLATGERHRVERIAASCCEGLSL